MKDGGHNIIKGPYRGEAELAGRLTSTPWLNFWAVCDMQNGKATVTLAAQKRGAKPIKRYLSYKRDNSFISYYGLEMHLVFMPNVGLRIYERRLSKTELEQLREISREPEKNFFPGIIDDVRVNGEKRLYDYQGEEGLKK